MPYLGSTPNASFSSRTKQDFTANGSTTAFTLNSAVASPNDIEVFVGNVRQEPTDAYTVNGTTLTMSEAPATGLNFYVVFKQLEENSVVPADGTISSAKIVSNAVTDAKIASNAVTDAKIATGITASKLSGDINYSNLPVGSVIQTVVGTSTTLVSTTSGTAQDLLSVSITPKFTNSLITLEGYISRFDISYNGNAYGSVYLINPAGAGITTAVAGDAGHNNANIISVFGNHSPN